jgi:Cytochrome P450
MEDLIQEEVRQFITFLRPFASSQLPVDMANQFNLPILNALWRITVGDRFEYTDPQLMDIIKRFGIFLQNLGNPAAVLAVTFPWIFKGSF